MFDRRIRGIALKKSKRYHQMPRPATFWLYLWYLLDLFEDDSTEPPAKHKKQVSEGVASDARKRGVAHRSSEASHCSL